MEEAERATREADVDSNDIRLGFEYLSEETHFDGWRISLVEARFRSPEGTEFTREVVRHPGAVAVVPITDDGHAVLVRQYRGAVDRALLEIPAGTLDVDGEDPISTAKRELAEEAGIEARYLQLLATVHNTPGFCDEVTLLYMATGLDFVEPDRHGEEEMQMVVEYLALDDVHRLVAEGVLTDAQTILGLLLAQKVLEQQK